MQDSIIHAKKELEETFDIINEAITIHDKDFNIIRANRAAEKMLGLLFHKILSQKCYKSYHGTDCPPEICPSCQTLKTGEPCVSEIFEPYLDKYLEIKALPRFDSDNQLIGLVHVVRDITKRKQAEGLLRESEEKYRRQFDEALDAIFIADATTGILIDCNRAASELVGREKSELIGKHQQIFHPPEEREEKFSRTFRQHLEEKEGRSLDAKVITKGGKIRDVSIKANLFEINGRKILQGIFRDITERKRMEEELLKARKLESVGILAGGIAHDFNNLLQGILGNVSFAKRLSNPENKIYKILDKAESSYMRAISLTNQLITFSKGGEPVKKTVFIRNLIKDTTNFTLSGSSIRSKFNIPDNLWPVDVDEGQITRVIQNIVLNARDAIPEAGTINVTAENTTVREKENIALNNGKYIKITIEDDGIGMPQKNLTKIFDPYFTTKDKVSEKGMGLGLAICYSIIKNHEGLITVESKPKVGTTFHIYLPASEKEIEKKKEAKVLSLTEKGRLLIMDDEEVVADITKEFLKHIGYEVEVARDGEEAIELYKKAMESEKPFDVAILDLTIPGGMGGKETIGKLLEIDTDVKAIATSGYSNNPVMTEFAQYGFKGSLIKPYKIEKLGEIISKLM